MSEYPYHKSLHLKNFTVFKDVKFNFVPGINVFVGENGTGKTHVMKAIYAFRSSYFHEMQTPEESDNDFDALHSALQRVFQANPRDIVRLGVGEKARAEVSGTYNKKEWKYSVGRSATSFIGEFFGQITSTEYPVFIPAIDMMAHTRGFLASNRLVQLDFDLTCLDVVTLLEARRPEQRVSENLLDSLANLLGGTIERENDGRFYLVTDLGRIPMPMVAEGMRKIATLLQLYQNGWLAPGATLFWDEPEVNLNPVVMDKVVGALLALARTGVQVFLATHSYIILREIEVQAQKSDTFRYFSLFQTEDGVKVNPANDYLSISPNSIERQYADLYDRGIQKRLNNMGAKR